MQAIFVTGASGLLGKSLVEKLLEDGYRVRALVHNTIPKSHPNLVQIKGDVNILSSFHNAMKGVDAVFHLAGIVTDWAPQTLYYSVHLDGTKNVVSAVISNKIKKFVYISTIDIFAHEKYKTLNEETPLTFSTVPYRRSKLLAYKFLTQEVNWGNTEAIIICPAWIYGSGDKIFLREIIRQLKARNFLYIGRKNNLIPLIHVDNLAILLINFIEKEGARESPQTYVVSDGEISWGSLIEVMCEELQMTPPIISLPYKVAYCIGWTMESVGKILKIKGRPLLTRTAVETVGRSIIVESQKVKTVMGYVPSTNLNKGLRSAINSIVAEEKI